MKSFAKAILGFLAVAFIAGCAGVYIPPVPDEMDAQLNDYYKLPGNKVFMVAIDPNGDYTFAYEYGKDTVREAAEVATVKCDESRKKMNIISKPIIYAVNNKIVYQKVLHAEHNKK